MPAAWEQAPVVGEDNSEPAWKSAPLVDQSSSPTPETDKAVAQTAGQVAKNAALAVYDYGKEFVKGAVTNPVTTVAGFLTPVVGAAQDLKQDISTIQKGPSQPQSGYLHEALQQPLFSRGWWQGPVHLAADVGMAALLKKGLSSHVSPVESPPIQTATSLPKTVETQPQVNVQGTEAMPVPEGGQAPAISDLTKTGERGDIIEKEQIHEGQQENVGQIGGTPGWQTGKLQGVHGEVQAPESTEGGVPRLQRAADEQAGELGSKSGVATAAPETPTTQGEVAPQGRASVPVMITRAMEDQLRARGLTVEQINKLTPIEANNILSQPVSSATQAPSDTGVPPQETISAGKPEAAPEVPVPESMGAGAVPPKTTGVAQRVSDARAKEGDIGEIIPGVGTSASTQVLRGRQLLSEGVNPYQAVNDFKTGKRLSADDFAAVRAHQENLAKVTNAAYDQWQTQPDNPQLRSNYDQAFATETNWLQNAVKPMSTEWHKIGMGHQGETEIDTGSFLGLRRAVMDEKGRDITPQEAPILEKTAKMVQKASQDEVAARQRLSETVKKAVGKRTPRTAEELRAHFADRIRQLTPC